MLRQQFNPVQMNVAEIRYALQHDAEFFIQFFLGDELTKPVPDFHIDTFHLMTSTDVERCAFALPRDHAKTTLAKLACVWYFLFSPYQFAVYLSNVLVTAVPAVNDVIGFLMCDNFRTVYGDIKFEKKQDGIGFYVFSIDLPDELGGTFTKECMLRALGAGQSVRGINIKHRRPQLAIIDDLEDTENIATKELFIKLKRWFYGTFRKCLDKFNSKMIQIGNMISNFCLLNEHCNSEYWFSRRYGCLLANGKPLWEDAWPLSKLRMEFNEYLKAGMLDVWFAEMMNLPLGAGLGLIRPSDLNYRPSVMDGEIEYGFITIDLAISEESWAHKTAIACHGWVGDCWQIVELQSGTGIDPIELFRIIVSMALRWRISYVGIENTAYQASLKPVYTYLCELDQIEGIIFVPLIAGVRKTQRLASWAAMIKEGEYALTEGDFVITEQLLQYNPSKRDNKDDEIDACAYGPQMIDLYIAEIMDSVFEGGYSGAVVSGYAVAEI